MKPVYLIACSSTKSAVPAPARSFYLGALFKGSVKVAEAAGCHWLVLSALHGVVSPDQVLKPYDFSMSAGSARATKAEAEEWANRVHGELRDLYPGGQSFVSLVSKPYEAALYGLDFSSPMVGLPIGRRLQWLAQELERLSPTAKQGGLWTS